MVDDPNNSGSDAELDLDAQLDALIAGVKQQETWTGGPDSSPSEKKEMSNDSPDPLIELPAIQGEAATADLSLATSEPTSDENFDVQIEVMLDDLLGKQEGSAEPVLLDDASNPPPAKAAAAEDEPTDETNADVESAFETPDNILADGAPDSEDAEPVLPGVTESEGFEANADSVAAELDSQPENVAKAVPDSDGSKKRKARKTKIVIKRPALKRVCGVLNWPVERLSPGTRTIVGYLGVLHFFLGTVLIVVSLIRLMMSGD